MTTYQIPHTVKGKWQPSAIIAFIVTVVCVRMAFVDMPLGTIGLILILGYSFSIVFLVVYLINQVRFEAEYIIFRNSYLELKKVPYKEIKRIEVRKSTAIRGGTHYRIELLSSDDDEYAEHFDLSSFGHRNAALIINTLAVYSGAPLGDLASKISSGKIKGV